MVASLFPLKLIDAHIIKRGKRIIGPVDLTLNEGGITAIIGPNGSGKTSLLRMLHGIERISKGDMIWGDYCDEKLVDVLKSQAFVFQNPIMLRRTVIDNLIYPLRLTGMAKREALKIADQWLGKVGLEASRDKDALVLSGGERQRLALARALATKPKVLFLDEPTSNLDSRSMMEVEQLILGARDEGVKIIIATHDFGQLKRLADEIVFLLNGEIHEVGEASALLEGAGNVATRKFLNGDIVL